MTSKFNIVIANSPVTFVDLRVPALCKNKNGPGKGPFGGFE